MKGALIAGCFLLAFTVTGCGDRSAARSTRGLDSKALAPAARYVRLLYLEGNCRGAVLLRAQPDPDRVYDDDLATVEEIAAFLRVPTSWVYERTRRRGIPRW